MSEQDRIILERLQLSQRQLAKLLERSRTAVNRGINSEKNYLNLDRSRFLYSKLLMSDPGRANILKTAADSIAPDIARHLDDPRQAKVDDNPRQQQFRELWIVSSRPRELTEHGYLDVMVQDHLSDSRKKLVYFLAPGGDANRLASDIERKLLGRSCAEIEIFEVLNLEISPHYVVFEPQDEGAYGLVRTKVYSFAKLVEHETHLLLIALSRIRETLEPVHVVKKKEVAES